MCNWQGIDKEIDKEISITNAFQKFFKKSNRKPKKIWVDKGNQFYSRSIKSWLEKNATELHSMHNEKNILLLKDLLERTLKNKIYKYMTSISKKVYTDKLDDIVNKCNNTYHSTVKMRTVDVKPRWGNCCNILGKRIKNSK